MWNYYYDEREERYMIFFKDDVNHIFKTAKTE